MKHHVLCGVDRADALSDYVSGKKIALLTAASGVNRYGVPTYDVIRAAGAGRMAHPGAYTSTGIARSTPPITL